MKRTKRNSKPWKSATSTAIKFGSDVPRHSGAARTKRWEALRAYLKKHRRATLEDRTWPNDAAMSQMTISSRAVVCVIGHAASPNLSRRFSANGVRPKRCKRHHPPLKLCQNFNGSLRMTLPRPARVPGRYPWD
jgi:hypothetical protein